MSEQFEREVIDRLARIEQVAEDHHLEIRERMTRHETDDNHRFELLHSRVSKAAKASRRPAVTGASAGGVLFALLETAKAIWGR